MPTYACVAEIKEEMAAGSDSNTVEDPKLLRLARKATARLDKLLQSTKHLPFFPQIDTRQMMLDREHVSSSNNTFWFQQPLLALGSLDAGGTALAAGTDVELWPTLQSPADTLRLLSFSNNWYRYLPSSGAPGMVTITGTWGVNSNYQNAWLAVDTLIVPNPGTQITADATVFEVSDAGGIDPYGMEPRLSPGQLIKINSEFMDVIAVDYDDDQLTVVRGVLGSTKATHENSAAISVWQVEEPVRRLVARQTAFMYARKGAFESSTVSDFGVINFPSDQLGEVRGILQGYAYGTY